MYTRAREEARSILVELGQEAGLVAPDAQVIAGNFAARELQRVSEQQATGVMVLGSTHRRRAGRLLPGGVVERLLTGAACPIAIAPRGYAEDSPARLTRIGVATAQMSRAKPCPPRASSRGCPEPSCV